MGPLSWTVILLLSTAVAAAGQPCPTASDSGASMQPEVRTLDGRLIFHDGIRRWFGLVPDQSQCGQSSIELVWAKGSWEPMAVLRGCRVQSRGVLDYSHTGYVSREMFQEVQSIKAAGTCERQPPLPDYSRARPDKSIREYRVEMQVNYRPGDHPIVLHVTSAGTELQPSQAYAGYWLTGGFALRGSCGHGFVVDKVFGTPEARPSHFDEPRTPDDMAWFDPESAAEAGKWDLQLGYTCVRRH
jgi:hypothetical protein